MPTSHKSKLLIISHVPPFPKTSGQILRVFNTMFYAQQEFHVTFLTSETFMNAGADAEKIRTVADEVIVMPGIYKKNKALRSIIKLFGIVYTTITGLKFSNFIIGKIEFTSKRISKAIDGQKFDLVLYEYWHGYKSSIVFKNMSTLTLLDTHNVLWQTYLQFENNGSLKFIKKIRSAQYKKCEESSWNYFDGVIAINTNEFEYIKSRVSPSVKLFLMGMGVDTDNWIYNWYPALPPRLSFYGGLGSIPNKANAMFCAQAIMPLVWEKIPDAQFWIIGNNPDSEILALQQDKRIVVTGYVEDVQDVLKTISVMLCPWQGKYGFRSRLIEVMACGVPVVCSKDAVDGMELEAEMGLFYANTADEFAGLTISLLNNCDNLKKHSLNARAQVEQKYDISKTYLNGASLFKTWSLKK